MNQKGFTLIEILVSIAVIGVMASIVIVGITQSRSKERDARRMSDIRQIQGAIQNYFSSCFRFPNVLSELITSSSVCPQYTPLLSAIPRDPLDNSEYIYFVDNEGPKKYHLCSRKLEKSLPDTSIRTGFDLSTSTFGGGDPCKSVNVDKIFDVVGGAY